MAHNRGQLVLINVLSFLGSGILENLFDFSFFHFISYTRGLERNSSDESVIIKPNVVIYIMSNEVKHFL